MKCYDTVEAVDGSRHRRKITVLADGYAICARVPAWEGDRRYSLIQKWRGSWYTDRTIGTPGALRDMVARAVAEGRTSTTNADIQARADRMRVQWERQEKDAREAKERETARLARDQAEFDAFLGRKVRLVKGAVGTLLAGGEKVEQDAMVTRCGTWSIHRGAGGRYVVSHAPSGYAVASSGMMRHVRALVAAFVAAGYDQHDHRELPKQDLSDTIRNAMRVGALVRLGA